MSSNYDIMTQNDPDKKFIKIQMILAVIPIFVTQLFAFYRIQKLIYGIMIEVIIYFVDWLIQSSISWPFGLIVFLPISILIPLYFVRKWTLEFNQSKHRF
ncbi:MAG: hypothetical protein ACREA5_02290 [Nitrosotalea sp.]